MSSMQQNIVGHTSLDSKNSQSLLHGTETWGLLGYAQLCGMALPGAHLVAANPGIFAVWHV